MEIINIFAIEIKALYAVQFEQNDCDEFALAFRNWNDTEYLEEFFENNKDDLQSGYYGKISVEDAIFSTIEEANNFEAEIKKVAKEGSLDKENSLQDIIFHPFHKNDTTFILQETRAYGTSYNSWLRLYAIRISPQCFVVVGSAIKLTGANQDRTHTNDQLKKLKIGAEYLKSQGLLEDDDFGYIDIAH